MGSEVKPLPCPALGCGGEGLVPEWHGEFVHCSRCNMRGPLSGGTEEAVRAWNEIAALRARVRELEGFVREELRVSERVQGVRERQGSTKPLERKTLAVGSKRIEKMRALLTPPRAEEAERA